MYFVENAIRKRGGLARTWELAVDGIAAEFVELAVEMGRIVRLRRGWYAVVDLDPALAAAVRLGGTLACRSARRRAALDPHACGGAAPGGAAGGGRAPSCAVRARPAGR